MDHLRRRRGDRLSAMESVVDWRPAAMLGILIALVPVAGCERSAEASRALAAERRASWSRELGGIREQHAALVARLGQRGADPGISPALRRTQAMLDGTRQSITDVDAQFAQAEMRMEQAFRRGGEAGQRAIDDESARARSYLQALGEQIGATAQQIEELARSEDEAKRQSP